MIPVLVALLTAQGVDTSAVLPPAVADLVLPASAPAMVLAFCWLVFTGRLVPRRTYEDMRTDRDNWRQLALRSFGHANRLGVGAEVAADALRTLAGVATEQEPTR